jgi:hypothetical protein
MLILILMLKLLCVSRTCCYCTCVMWLLRCCTVAHDVVHMLTCCAIDIAAAHDVAIDVAAAVDV